MGSPPEESPKPDAPPMVDWDSARVKLPGSLFSEIAATVPGENRRLLAEVRRALDAGDASALAFALHGLKNNVLYFLREDLAALFYESERAARSGELEFVRTRLGELASILDALAAELDAPPSSPEETRS